MLLTVITGRVGKDAEVKQFDNDRAVINFSVAHTERWKNQQGVKQERTHWVECSYWKTHAQAANMAQYIKKGMIVSCKGMPEARAYADATGKPAASLGLTLDSMTLESGRTEASGTGTATAAPAQQQAPAAQAAKPSLITAPDLPTIPPPTTPPDADDDLPF